MEFLKKIYYCAKEMLNTNDKYNDTIIKWICQMGLLEQTYYLQSC